MKGVRAADTGRVAEIMSVGESKKVEEDLEKLD